MHQVVTAQLAARRAGTQSTKTRAEVARRRRQAVAAEGHRPGPPGLDPVAAVARRRRGPRPEAPLLRASSTPKKMVRLALRSALSDRAAEGKVVVVDDWGFDAPVDQGAPSPRSAALGVDGPGPRRARRRTTRSPWKSFRNLATVHRSCARELNAYDVLVDRLGRLHPGDAARPRRRRRRPTTAEAPSDGTEEDDVMKDPRDVIIAPVVQREVLRAARRQRLHVHGPPRRRQARDPRRRRGDLRRARSSR